MRNYKELKIWKRAVDLASLIYSLSSQFPVEERFGLTSQIRRAVVSVSSNIAEGSGRTTDKEFSRFIDIAYGSLCEIETQIKVAHKLHYIDDIDLRSHLKEINELQKMVFTFSKTLKKAQSS